MKRKTKRRPKLTLCPPVAKWAGRDFALSVLREFYPAAVLRAVVRRYTSPEHEAQSAKWWAVEIVYENASPRARRVLDASSRGIRLVGSNLWSGPQRCGPDR